MIFLSQRCFGENLLVLNGVLFCEPDNDDVVIVVGMVSFALSESCGVWWF